MNRNNIIIYPIERIIAVLSYYTFGLTGLLYLIIAAIKKQGLRPFLRYHVLMSIFISILIYVVSMVLIFLIDILGFFPFIRAIVFSISLIFQSVLFSIGELHFSIVTLIVSGLLTYLAIGALFGKYTYLPWISNIINYNLRQ